MPSTRHVRGARPASIALLAVLAIASGGTAPVFGGGDRAIAGASATSPQVRETSADRAATRDAAWDSRAEAALGESSAPHGAFINVNRDPRQAALARTTAPANIEATGNAQTFRGTNHFWVPSLGMSFGVHSYACGRTSYPGNYVYRWGCAGNNNVYLLGHAHSVMKPLHDLYVRGGLRVGMIALYADGAGRIRAYQVTEWRVVRPTQIAWQIASQSVPSMTLQTCVGKNSEYRLNVRLVAI